ncbi:TetR/AcrR family transcriptional regulator [Acrocarpospora catenulata]|uniref:TetR/AcrR family transcriptional regulator n=1 Tax=Acrocarpospora catenulata TaxID=2836182 RepID=UPI001BDA054F|nr:TetR family transcriptional regulator [Acrocarpospora catenulata]
MTLELIAEAGVAGTSHRKIAARAGVPLGSMTYHFNGMDELLFEAFTRFAETIITQFEKRLSAATTIDEAKEAIVGLIHQDLTGPQTARDGVLAFELYTLAAREPRFRAITREWMRRSRVELERHFDPDTARQVDALIEGLWIHRSLDPEPLDRGITKDAITRITTRQS